MSRDFRKLHVFQLADELMMRVYEISSFPRDERFSLQAQLRRAAYRRPPTSLKDLRAEPRANS